MVPWPLCLTLLSCSSLDSTLDSFSSSCSIPVFISQILWFWCVPIKYKSSLYRLNLGSSRSLSHVLNKGSSSPTFLPSPCTHLTRMLNAPGGLLLDLLPLDSERQHRGKNGITLMRLPSCFQHSSNHTPDYVDNSKHCRKIGIYLCDSAKVHLAHLLTARPFDANE